MRLLAPTLAACLWLLGCQQTAPAPRPEPVLHVTQVDSPAGPNSAEPFLAPGRDGALLLSWLERPQNGSPRLRVAVRDRSGAWGNARSVVESPALFVNWADFPSVVTAGDGSVAAHWLEKTANAPYAYDVKLARSWDDGKSWTPAIVAHQDRSPVEHGFVSLLSSAGSTLELIWLDGRTEGQMALRHARFEGATTVSGETVLDDKVCDCCPTALARTSKGLIAAYRDRSDDEIRDVSVVLERGGTWSAPRRVAADGWRITGCPVNGPQLDASGDDVALAWFTMHGDKPTVQVAFSNDSGDTFGAPLAVDEGDPLGRVDVALLEGRALVTWIARNSNGASLRARVMTPAGAHPPSVGVTGTTPLREGGVPRLARIENDVFVAWTAAHEPSRVRLAKLTERLEP